MANEGYDKKADRERDPFNAGKSKEKSVSAGGLDNHERQASSDAGDSFGRGRDTGSAENAFGRSSSSGSGVDAGDDGLYKPGGDDQGRSGSAGNRGKNRPSQLRRALKSKWLVGGALGGSGAIIFLVIVVALLGGAYKVVDFAENVAAYEFARDTTQMAEDTTAIDAEKIGLESIPDNAEGNTLYQALKSKYSSATGTVDDLWGNLDDYRPSKVISNFQNAGTLSFDEVPASFGRTTIGSVTISGVTHQLQPTNMTTALKNKFIPGYKFTNDVSLSRDLAPDLIDALKANDIGPITRARVASAIREELDISLIAWATGKYFGKTAEQSNELVEQNSLSVAEGTGTPTNANVNVDDVNDAAEAAETAENTAVNDPTKIAQIVADGGQLPADYIASLQGAFPAAGFSSVQGAIADLVGLANPVYKYAVPLCLIYDGSLKSSGPTIDNQNAQMERSAVLVQSAAAQEKDGTDVNAEAVGATDWKLGDITSSNAEERSSGQIINTSNYSSTEASPTGEYSIADYGLGSTLGGVVDYLAPDVCPALTNLTTGAIVGVVGLLVAPGATTSVEDGVADAATQSLGRQMINKIVGVGIAGRSALSDVFSLDTLRTIGITGVGTLVAKSLVAHQTGAVHNSLATGQSYDDDVDSGTNIYANQIQQQQFYGAPLTDQSLAQDNAQDQEQLSEENSQQSPFNRYLALSNANSLVSHLVIDASAYTNSSVFSSLLHLGGILLDPIRTIGSLLSPMISQSSFAASTVTSVNSFYGNVQFGFTQYEESLIKNDPSYAPLENQLDLDESGQEAQIDARYSVCFTDSIGDLLANGDIQRRSNGDVIPNKGLCSPSHLGTNNQDSGYGPAGAGFHDLVFRWRVAKGYDKTLQQLTDEQTVTSSDTAPTTPPPSTTGYENPLRGVTDLGVSRIDQGVDFTGSGPVYAMGNGKVLNVSNSGWTGVGTTPTFIVYQLSDGPAEGKYVYFAEGCTPNVAIGDTVTTGTVICNMLAGGNSIETGWANGSSLGDALAKPVYTETHSTAYGQNYRELLTSLGVTVGSCYDRPGSALEGYPLPASWPTWVPHPATVSGTPACPPSSI